MAGAADSARALAALRSQPGRLPGGRYVDQALLGRWLMTVATLMYGVVPLLVDLTETHVFHPDWPGHARFHMVWLLAQLAGTAGLALGLMWYRPLQGTFFASSFRSGAGAARSADTTDTAEAGLWRVRLAGVLGLIALGSFYTSAITAGLYGGALADAQGVPPLWGLDANLVSFSVALVLLLVGLWLAHQRDPW